MCVYLYEKSKIERRKKLGKFVKSIQDAKRSNIETTWLKDGSVLGSGGKGGRVRVAKNGSLILKHVVSQDEGLYKCIEHDSLAIKPSLPMKLVVYEKPRILESSGDQVAPIGGSVTLTCIAVGNPAPIVKWSKVKGNIDHERSNASEKSLKISGVRVEDEGTYVCMVENMVGRTMNEIKLRVHTPPSFIIIPVDKVVSVGRRATIDCYAEGHPTPEIYWNKEDSDTVKAMFSGREYENGRVKISKFGSLTIERARKSDAGAYRCHAESPAGKATSSASLQVKAGHNHNPPPIILIGSKNETLALMTTAELVCNASGVPTPIISWYKDDKPLSLQTKKHRIIDQGTLKIERLNLTDSGKYTCKASNELGEAMWSNYLAVEDPSDTAIIFKKTPEPSSFPGPPLNLQISELDETSLRLSWVSNPNNGYSPVHSYVVEAYNFDLGDTWVVVGENFNDTTFLITNLPPSAHLIFLVRAVNSHGSSLPSSTTSVVTTKSKHSNKPTFFDRHSHHHHQFLYIHLHQPRDITATSANLRWDIKQSARQLPSKSPPDDLVTGFYVKYSLTTSAHYPHEKLHFTTFATTDKDTRNIKVTGLTPNSLYVFYIEPSSHSNLTSSNSLTLQTLESVPASPPLGIKAVFLGNSTLHVLWQPPPPSLRHGAIVTYKVYVSALNSKPDRWTNTSATQVYIGNMDSTDTYKIQLSACTSAGEGPISSPVFVGPDSDKALHHFQSLPSSSSSSKDHIWWIFLLVVLSVLLVLIILLCLFVLLKMQKHRSKENGFFTNQGTGDLKGDIAKTNKINEYTDNKTNIHTAVTLDACENDMKEEETNDDINDNMYENLSSVYSTQSIRESNLNQQMSPVVLKLCNKSNNNSARFDNSSNNINSENNNSTLSNKNSTNSLNNTTTSYAGDDVLPSRKLSKQNSYNTGNAELFKFQNYMIKKDSQDYPPEGKFSKLNGGVVVMKSPHGNNYHDIRDLNLGTVALPGGLSFVQTPTNYLQPSHYSVLTQNNCEAHNDHFIPPETPRHFYTLSNRTPKTHFPTSFNKTNHFQINGLNVTSNVFKYNLDNTAP